MTKTVAGKVDTSVRGQAKYPRIHPQTPITHFREIRRHSEIRPWEMISDFAACMTDGSLIVFGPLKPTKQELGYAVPASPSYWCAGARGFHMASDCEIVGHEVLTSAQVYGAN